MRIAPAYGRPTVHVLDASRVVGVVSDLLDPVRSKQLDEANRAEQERLREAHAEKERRPLLPLARGARERASSSPSTTSPTPAFTGTRVVEPSLAELRELIDWQFFFHAWELKGKFPAILEQPAARELYDDATTLLDEIVARRAAAGARRVRVLAGARRRRRHRARERRPLPDAAPAGGVGRLAAEPLARRLRRPGRRPPRRLRRRDPRCRRAGGAATRPSTTTTARSWSRRSPTGSPRRSPNTSTCEARRAWYEPDAAPTGEELVAERYRGIRPAFGYPACPDHSEKRRLFDLLGAERPASG